MPHVAICTSLYEAGRQYLQDFSDGVNASIAAASNFQTTVVAASDGFIDANNALQSAGIRAETRIVDLPYGLTPAEVRAAMIVEGLNSGARILVFHDMDDRPTEGSITMHAAVLADADFSYGDMELIDESGQGLGRYFFDGITIADNLSGPHGLSEILDHNFLGFTNTAIRADKIPDTALKIPSDVAAADWWFFTALLFAGLEGRRVPGTVVHYRSHSGNILGVGPGTGGEILARLRIAGRHYDRFSAYPEYKRRSEAVRSLILKFTRNSSDGTDLESCVLKDGLWFDDVKVLVHGELSESI
jgi:hypothetical protein